MEREMVIEKYLKARAIRTESDISISDQEKWALIKSVRNMLNFYRADLLGLMKGRSIVDSIPKGTRKSFVEHGVLRKFGSKIELTEMGRDLLLSNAVR